MDEKKIAITIHVEKKQYDYLNKMKDVFGVPMAHVVREALAPHIKKNPLTKFKKRKE